MKLFEPKYYMIVTTISKTVTLSSVFVAWLKVILASMNVRWTQIQWRWVFWRFHGLGDLPQTFLFPISGASCWSGYQTPGLHLGPVPSPGEVAGCARGAGGGEHHHHPGGARHLLQAGARDPGQHHLCGELPQAAGAHLLVSQWPGQWDGIATC